MADAPPSGPPGRSSAVPQQLPTVATVAVAYFAVALALTRLISSTLGGQGAEAQ
jgi:hypothetical protein